MTWVVRNALASDAAAIGSLAQEFQQYLSSLCDDADFHWGAAEYLRDGFGDDRMFEGFVAEQDGAVVGFTLFHPGYDTDRGERGIYMTDLFVTASFQGRGVGEHLIERVAECGRERGVQWIAWSVLKTNTRAVKFYERLGASYADALHQMVIAVDKLKSTRSSGSTGDV